MAGAAWLLAACVLAACGGTLAALHVTWPGCSRTRKWTTMEVVQPGQTNTFVTGINLKECNFSTVDLETFRAYPNLEDVELEDIKITNITALASDSFVNLQLLTLANTSTLGKNLPSNLFQNCRRLRYLAIINNDLRDTPADILQGLDLKMLFLHKTNFLEVPPLFTSQRLPYLDHFLLNSNKISVLPATMLANAANLTILTVTYNQLVYLPSDLLKPLDKVTKVHLFGNKLKDIPEALFQYKPFLYHVSLSNNQIEHIPLNAFLGTDLKTLLLNGNRLVYLPSNFISNLQATGISLDLFYFDKNPWECACLNRLLVMVKKLAIIYRSTNFDGKHESCTIRQVTLLINNNHC